MGKPTFDSRNSKTLVLGFDWETERLQDHDDASRRGFGFPVIKRRYETSEYIGGFKRTQGTETSKYLEEKKERSIPVVAASEVGRAQTGLVRGCRTFRIDKS